MVMIVSFDRPWKIAEYLQPETFACKFTPLFENQKENTTNIYNKLSQILHKYIP